MRLLAFETATEGCSVALYLDGEVRERFAVAPRRHAELALPWTEVLLAEAGIARSSLDAIACGRGPGAFTGVRLAVAVTQGIALGLDRPVVGISTLAALALDAPPGARVVAAIDARMGEVYLGCFARDAEALVVPLQPELLGAPDAIAVPDGRWVGVGTGFAAQESVLARRASAQAERIDGAALPHAAAVARLAARALRLGQGIAADALEPAYLRDKVALTLAEQRRSKQ